MGSMRLTVRPQQTILRVKDFTDEQQNQTIADGLVVAELKPVHHFRCD